MTNRSAGRQLFLFLLIAMPYVLQSQPVISSFSPQSGTPGTSVTITGNNFIASPSKNIVYFGTVRAIISAATATILRVTVPEGATTQPVMVLTNHLTGYSALPFNVVSAGVGVTKFRPSSFIKVLDLFPGLNPRSVAVGDFNNDGKPDLAVTNQTSNSVSFFKNTSLGDSISFAPAVNIPVGSGAFDIAIADFNGDGALDVAVTNFNSGNQSTVSLLINTGRNGKISFITNASLTYVTGSGSIGIASGDLNNDGKVDFAVGSSNSGFFSVFQNSSTSIKNISFLNKQDYFNFNRPDNLSITDLDNNGKQELLTANSIAGSLSLYNNNSSNTNISLQYSTDYSTGTWPNNVSVADLDLDGKADLTVPGSTAASVSVLRNLSTGAGNISFAPHIDFPTGSSPERSAVMDLDGDGKPEIIIANEQSNTISVLKNLSTPGNIAFAAKADYATALNPACVVAGDLNGDGKPELIVTNSTSGTVSIYKNQIKSKATAKDVWPASSLNTNQDQDLKNFPAQTELHIYPNPVKDKINIQSTVDATYILTDESGNNISTQKINGNGSINVSRLQPGIYYLVNIGTGNSYKILKN